MLVQSLKAIRGTLALALGACLLAGCSDMLTYSQDFKREGIAQYDQGDYTAAAGSFKAAAKQDPTDYQTRYYLGTAYEKTGDTQMADESFRLCLKLMAQSPKGRSDADTHDKALDHLATLIGKSDSPDAEIDGIQKTAQTTHSAESYQLLARIFAVRGDPDSAVENYRQAVAIAPSDFNLQKEFGLYLVKINQTAEADRVLRTAYKLNPTDRQVITTIRQLAAGQNSASDARIEPKALTADAPRN